MRISDVLRYTLCELHPHSDVDILILLGENHQDCQAQLEGFLTLLWDIGLNVGHSVRSVTECAELAATDITILTNLMEARVIRGSKALMQQVRELTSPDRMWSSPDFFRAKLEEGHPGGLNVLENPNLIRTQVRSGDSHDQGHALNHRSRSSS